MSGLRVGVFGAGLVGSYVGVRLSAAGAAVTLLGRDRDNDPEHLVAVGLEGRRVRPGADLRVTTDPRDLAEMDVCLVTVKSRDTADAAATMAEVLPPKVVVMSLQNGLHNAEVLAEGLANPVAGGVVTFNLYRDEAGHLHQASRGKLFVQHLPGSPGDCLRALQTLARAGGESLILRSDIRAVLAGKLLLNLNNGICAATGLGIAGSLRSGDARHCFALSIREGLACMEAAGLHPARVAPIPPRWLAGVLALPDFVVLRLAKPLVAIDPGARSSTLQDLDRGNPTEIDDLNGEIVALAQAGGREAPVNALIVAVVHGHEAAVERGQRPSFWSPAKLRAEIDRRVGRH